MYRLIDILQQLQRSPKEVERVCKSNNIGVDGVYSEEDLEFLKSFFSKDKRGLLLEIMEILYANPFITQKELAQKFGRPLSYTTRLLSILPKEFPQPLLAETDDGLLFFVTVDTEYTLKKIGDWELHDKR